jgi:hypothetical protein
MKMTPQLLALLTLGAVGVHAISACADDAEGEGEPAAQREAVEVRTDGGADAAVADASVGAPEAPAFDPATDGCPACGLG